MTRWAADENFDNNIIRVLRTRAPGINLVRVQDAGLSGADDPTVLQWCAANSRILLTHDKATIPRHAYERISESRPMPGVFIIPLDQPAGAVADDVLLATRYSEPGEWDARVVYLPL